MPTMNVSLTKEMVDYVSNEVDAENMAPPARSCAMRCAGTRSSGRSSATSWRFSDANSSWALTRWTGANSRPKPSPTLPTRSSPRAKLALPPDAAGRRRYPLDPAADEPPVRTPTGAPLRDIAASGRRSRRGGSVWSSHTTPQRDGSADTRLPCCSGGGPKECSSAPVVLLRQPVTPSEQQVVILRVLHERMDIDRHLLDALAGLKD